MNSKKLIAATMAAALTLSLTTGALAAGDTVPGHGGNTPGAGEIAKNGHTTISIMQAKQNPQNVSYEVPLYVTMAVIDSQADVATPTNYQIKNTTTAANGGFPIGVTAMYFEKLAGSTFDTVAAAPTTSANEILLKIGGATMPTLSTAVEAKVDLTGSVMVKADGKPTAIPAPLATPDGTEILALPVVGNVKSDTRADAGAVAQFRVKYTISALDADGKPLGTVYAGDDSYLAGLGDQK